jgi:hypothetical protein
MKTVSLSALFAVILGVGSVGTAFAQVGGGGTGAGEVAQGSRSDVVGSRYGYAPWPGPYYGAYGAYGDFRGPYVRRYRYIEVDPSIRDCRYPGACY